MKLYVLSCAVGLLVGVIYGVLDVKSPAPPVVALIGLLGMLGGEQIGKRVASWHFSRPTAHGTVVHDKSLTGAKPSNNDATRSTLASGAADAFQAQPVLDRGRKGDAVSERDRSHPRCPL